MGSIEGGTSLTHEGFTVHSTQPSETYNTASSKPKLNSPSSTRVQDFGVRA